MKEIQKGNETVEAPSVAVTTTTSTTGQKGSPMPVMLAVVLPLLVVYAATATWKLPYHIDPATNALAAWYMGTETTVYMAEHGQFVDPQYFGVVAWLVDSPGGTVAQYPPASAALAAPLYALIGSELTLAEITASNQPDLGSIQFPIPPLWPATLTAVLATSLAAGLLAASVHTLVGRRWAIGSGLAFGLATGAWAVASDMLWTHGPAMLFIAGGLYLCSRDRLALAGLAFGAAILTRPHLAVVAAGAGLAVGLAQRKLAPMLRVGAGAGTGLAALVLYNWSVFGQPSIRGGYHSGFVERLVSPDVGSYAANVWGAFFDLDRGLLIWAPFLIVLMVGIPRVWRRVPPWAIGAALGGVLYLLIQLKANRFSGGDGHFAYRYPLETLMASAPLLVLVAMEWAWERPLSQKMLVATVLIATAAQAVGAIPGIMQ